MKQIYEELLNNIHDYKVFLTPDELDENSEILAEKYSDCVEIFEIGKTTLGKPIKCLKIGNGAKNALMLGCPHPNEPIGTMMLEYFTEALAKSKELRDEIGYTWYVVKAWDRDGLELNNKWLKGPYSISEYSKHFYRPASYKQVEWTFPKKHKKLDFNEPISETIAVMKLIDEIKPEFSYSLHNAGFGGVYWYLSEGMDGLYDGLYNAAKKQEIPVHLGEPESPVLKVLAPAIYEMKGIDESYDYFEDMGLDPVKIIKCGTSSDDYARERHGTYTLLTELPYFYDARIKDLRESNSTRREIVLEKLNWLEKNNKNISAIIHVSKAYMSKDNPFYLAIESFTKDDYITAERNLVKTDDTYLRKATEAEVFDNLLVSKFYNLLSVGMLKRANEYELDNMKEKKIEDSVMEKALINARDQAEKEHAQLSKTLEEAFDYSVIPIKKLVAIQLECGLLTIERLKKELDQ